MPPTFSNFQRALDFSLTAAYQWRKTASIVVDASSGFLVFLGAHKEFLADRTVFCQVDEDGAITYP